MRGAGGDEARSSGHGGNTACEGISESSNDGECGLYVRGKTSENDGK